MQHLEEERLSWILLSLLTVAGLALRLGYLLGVPPFLDEYSSILTGMSILRTGGMPLLPSGVLYPSGSLFSYVEAAFLGVFGFSDAVARLPSLLISGLTMITLYFVAQRMLTRRAALLSVALFAFMPEAIVWGGRARMYALLQLCTLLTVFAFYDSVLDAGAGRDTPSRIPRWAWVAFFLAAIFSQDEAILLLPLLWLAALAARGIRWFFRPGVLLGQVLVPTVGVGARYWLNQIRVPGEVYVGMKASFFRFPPALAHGLVSIAPFFVDPSAWLATGFFFGGVALLLWRRIRGSGCAQPGIGRTVITAPGFLAYLVLAFAALILLVVNVPWQDDRYLFPVLPLYLMVAAWAMELGTRYLAQRWRILGGRSTTIVLVALVAAAGLPGATATLRRFEPDYSAAYRWLAPRFAADDLVATGRPAPAAVYLGRCDFLLAEDKHQEFVMRLDGVWVDRWTGARVLESPEAFRDQVLTSGQRVWFVIDEDRFESVAFSPEFVALIVEQMDLVWRQGGVLIFEGGGYQPPPKMEVRRALDADFAGQLRLAGYALSTDQPEPGQIVVLQLRWQAVQPERNYTVFVHLVGEDGQRLTQMDGEPYLGLYGMSTHWPRDRTVVDQRLLTIPEDTAAGRYRLEVGLYDAVVPDSSPLRLADGTNNLVLDYLKVGLSPPPPPSQKVDRGNLGGVVRLEGYAPPLPGKLGAGASMPLTLTWQCLDTMEENYTIFVHLAGADGQPLAQADGQPVGGSYPTRFWDAGERVADGRVLDVPGNVPPGEYELRVGMYLLPTGCRLPLLDANNSVVGDSILLDTVDIVAP